LPTYRTDNDHQLTSVYRTGIGVYRICLHSKILRERPLYQNGSRTQRVALVLHGSALFWRAASKSALG
jgi:hypothetical protein